MGTLILIPARFGSKGVLRKNIKILGDQPLISYTIEFAIKIKAENDLICITSNDNDVIQITQQYNEILTLCRPEELASDTAGMNDVLIHGLLHFEKQGIFFDKLLLLQPTTPFRDKSDYLIMASLFDKSTDMIVSVSESKANPYFNLFEEDSSGFLKKSKTGNFERRQDCPKTYEYIGYMYLIRTDKLKKHGLHGVKNIKKYEMPFSKSIDIDTELDWLIAENILKNKYDL
jgi:N-acylneuraminate cytidylyltransferase